jgi:hypothetical protein
MAEPALCNLHMPVAHSPTSTPPISFLLLIANHAVTTETF